MLFERALSAAREVGDVRAEAGALAQQGMLLHYRAIELPVEERATVDSAPERELFERALAIRREVEDTEGIAESLFQLGLVLQVLERDMESGGPLFRDALSLVETVPRADFFLRSEIHRHLGFDLLLRRELYDEALHHLQASHELRTHVDERGWQVGALVALSLGFRVAGARNEAIEHGRRALELARDEGLRERHVEASEDALRVAESMPS
jgi:tetratricopeptide (TPR) repeat protein